MSETRHYPLLRSLAGGRFRLGPYLRDFSDMAVRLGVAGRFRDGVNPNGMEVSLSLTHGLSIKWHIVIACVVDRAAYRYRVCCR